MQLKIPVLFFQTPAISLMLQRKLVTHITTPSPMSIVDLLKRISSLLDSSCANPHAAHLPLQTRILQETLAYSWAELKADEFHH